MWHYYLIVGYLSCSKNRNKINGFKILDLKNRFTFDVDLYEASQMEIRGVPNGFLEFIREKDYLKLSILDNLYLGNKSYYLGTLPVYVPRIGSDSGCDSARVAFNISKVIRVDGLYAVINLDDLSISYEYCWYDINTLEDCTYNGDYSSDIEVDKEFIDCLWGKPEIDIKANCTRVGNLATVNLRNCKDDSIILDSKCKYIVGADGSYLDFKGKELVLLRECEMIRLHHCEGIYGVKFKFSNDSIAIIDFCKDIFDFKYSGLFKEYCKDLRDKTGLSKEDALRKASVVYKLANEASKGIRLDKEDIGDALEILKGIGLNIEVY
jgi:hypothetical protein